MNVSRRIHIGAAVLVAGMTLAAVAQAAPNASPQRALEIRSQATNDRYNLDALNALQVRSDALNQRYHLGVYSNSAQTENAGALHALAMRGQAMNEQYHLGSYAVIRQSPNGFDYVDAMVGGAVVFGLVLVAGGIAVGARRFRGDRLTPA